jgi:hypothetical protein
MSSMEDSTLPPASKHTCQARKANGEPCGAGVRQGARYCFHHDPERAAEAAAARRAGGQARMRPAGQVVAAPAEPIDLSTPEAQRKAIEATIDRVRSGMEPLNIGRFVIYAISVARGVYDDDLARRLDALEAMLQQQERIPV